MVPDAPFDRGGKSTGMHFERARRVAGLYSLLHPARAVGVLSHSAVLSVDGLDLPLGRPRVVVEREYTPTFVAGRLGRRMVRTDMALVARGFEGLEALISGLGWLSRPLHDSPELVGVEIERRTGSKHLAGSVVLLSSLYPRGVLAVPPGRLGEARRLASSLGGGSVVVCEGGARA